MGSLEAKFNCDICQEDETYELWTSTLNFFSFFQGLVNKEAAITATKACMHMCGNQKLCSLVKMSTLLPNCLLCTYLEIHQCVSERLKLQKLQNLIFTTAFVWNVPSLNAQMLKFQVTLLCKYPLKSHLILKYSCVKQCAPFLLTPSSRHLMLEL